MDTHDANFPWPARSQLQREYEAAHRQLDRERYLGKFKPIWDDIELSIVALEVLAEYDSGAREAANTMRDALTDAKHTVEAGA